MSYHTAALGDIAGLDLLVTDLAYFKTVVTPGRGSRTLFPPGFVFVNIPGDSFRHHKGSSYALFGKPTALLLETVEPRCCNGHAGSVEVLPWAKDGKALVVARDTVHIAAPWIAFIPIDKIPSIEFKPEGALCHG